MNATGTNTAERISAMPITDPRVQKILPTLQKGEVCLANAFGQFVRLAKDGKVGPSVR